MARPKKENLDYFPFDVVFFGDKKIKRLKAQFGTDGICVYLYVLCDAYQNGYYAVWDEDLELDISEYFGFSEEKTRQIINCLLSRSLLKSILVKPVKVLTAESVQRRYQEAKKGAKRDIFVDERIWILEKEFTEPFIKMRPYENKSEKNTGFSEKNDNKSENNHTKESKEKESKEKESKEKESKVCSGIAIPCRNGEFIVDDSLLSDLTHTYPEMDVEKSLNKLRSYVSANPQKQGYIKSARAYIEMWLAEDNNAGKYRRKKHDICEAAYDIDDYESTSILDEDW